MYLWIEIVYVRQIYVKLRIYMKYIMSVSYTHLDVYKRQVLDAIGQIKDQNLEYETSCSGIKEFDAVSYTHLDVYKRQHLRLEVWMR